jgi:spore coat protein U-like protein
MVYARKFDLLATITFVLTLLPIAGEAEQTRGNFSVTVHVIRRCEMTIHMPYGPNSITIEGTIGINCTRDTGYTVFLIPDKDSYMRENEAKLVGVGNGNTQNIPVTYRILAQSSKQKGSNTRLIDLAVNY